MLPAKIKMVVDNYLKDPEKNKSRAYQVVYGGNNKSSVHSAASRLFKRDDVLVYLQEYDQKVTDFAVEDAGIEESRVLREESCMAFADPVHLVDENGQHRELRDIPESLRRAISTIKYKTELTKEVVDGKEVVDRHNYISEVRFWDKGRSLDRLEKILKLQQDGPGGTNIFSFKQILVLIDGQAKGKLPWEIG
jgi:hypothetical protein